MATRKSKVTSKNSSQRQIASATSVPPAALQTSDPDFQDELLSKIRERAYYKAQLRGFATGHDLEDWFEAEREQQAETSHSSAP